MADWGQKQQSKEDLGAWAQQNRAQEQGEAFNRQLKFDAAMEAKKPRYQYIPGGGGGGGMHTMGITPWSDVNSPEGLAQRIGKLTALMGADLGHTYGTVGDTMRDQAFKEMAPLQKLAAEQKKARALQQEFLKEQLRQMKNARKTVTSGGFGGTISGGGIPKEVYSFLGDMIQGPRNGNWNAREEPKREVVDPYKEVREAAIQAAKRYLSMPSPHKMRG